MKLLEAVYLIAIGFSFATALVVIWGIRSTNKLLVGLLSGIFFIHGFSNLMLLLIVSGWIAYVPHLFKLFMPFSFVLPVLIYWYVKGSLMKSFFIKKWEWMHLLPFLIIFIHYFPFFFSSTAEKQEIVNAIVLDSEGIFQYSFGWLFSEVEVIVIRAFHITFYLFASWRLLRKVDNKTEFANNRSMVLVKWIKFFLIAISLYTLMLILCFVFFELLYQGIRMEKMIEQIVLILTTLVMLILSSYLLLNPMALMAIGRPVDTLDLDNNYSLSTLMEFLKKNECYRDPFLNSTEILPQIGISKSEFSNLLKANGYRTFNHFINEVRLDCFVKEASSDALERTSIEGVAFKCGFKSQATFYRVFKQKYNTSPIAYLQGAEKA